MNYIELGSVPSNETPSHPIANLQECNKFRDMLEELFLVQWPAHISRNPHTIAFQIKLFPVGVYDDTCWEVIMQYDNSNLTECQFAAYVEANVPTNWTGNRDLEPFEA